MFSLLNPWLILTLILSLIGVYGAGHHYGYAQKEAEDEAVIAQKNQEMNDAKSKADDELYKANQKLAAKGVALSNAIRNGEQRLFVPVTAPAGCAASAAGDGQARAELDKSVGEALVRIALDGDKAIVQLNSCIDRYQSVRETASGKR
jgi:hypothetical protein